MAPVRIPTRTAGDAAGSPAHLTFFFPQPSGAAWQRALALMATLLHDDRRVLERLEFRPAFADSDEPRRAYARTGNALGAWQGWRRCA